MLYEKMKNGENILPFDVSLLCFIVITIIETAENQKKKKIKISKSFRVGESR